MLGLIAFEQARRIQEDQPRANRKPRSPLQMEVFLVRPDSTYNLSRDAAIR